MISQDLVDTAIDQFSKRLTLVVKVDILNIARIILNKAYTGCDKTMWHTSKLILLESVRNFALTFKRYHILNS